MAITNAFDEFRYRGMNFDEALGRDYLLAGWHPTNGFILMPFSADGSITNVSIGRNNKRWVPYVAYFHIVPESTATNETRVTVRTILSQVIDGTELFNVHGGIANHYRRVPPVRQEEENVLSVIEQKLRRDGKTGAGNSGP